MLLDLGLPGGSGFDVLTALADRPRPPTIVVVTARDDMQSTVKAIQLGAYEYLVKPVDIDRLRRVVKQALDSRDARDQMEALVTRSAEARLVGDILGRSAAIRDVWKQIGAVSTTRAPVLITGESGTGKELVARAIHFSSADRDRPFVAVNCTALAPGVLESELFGHVKGAFTGAIADRPGRFELAGKGTLLLDEIAEIPLELQAKLLRVVQERTFERVGDARPIALDARDHRRDPPRSGGDGRQAAASARTCSTGCGWSRSRCRRCASGRATSRSSSRACSRRSTATSARTSAT